MAKLRLVKVIVQPVFVLDDDENVTEIDHQPVAIPAAEWPSYSGVRFPREVKAWQRRLDAEAQPKRKLTAKERADRARAKHAPRR
jgi:hypothetical protein